SISKNSPIITYGLSPDAKIRAENIKIGTTETEFKLISPFGNSKVCLNHLGKHNVYNALASIAAALYSDIDLNVAISGLEKQKSVPGRLEKIDIDRPYTVVIDYAHTDDALKNVLMAMREIKPERIITVFGCGGDRDRAKRPLMGEIATELSDFVFVTSDNPRSESPESIILDVEVGIKRKYRTNYRNMIDREQAIAAAIKMAQKGDVVLIAGKGHETYQIIGDKRIAFSDIEIAKQYMSR
ncbi:Mur ligase family protein, partial [Elusimicrobiota bacterium]